MSGSNAVTANVATTKPFSLANARETTPAPVGVGTWAAKMKAAAQAAITEGDVSEILGKQVEKAKSGDAAAAKFVLGFVAGNDPPPKELKIIEKVKVIHRGGKSNRTKSVKGGNGSEEPRVVDASEVEPPKPVAVDSPAVKQLRLLVGLYLAQNHNAKVAEMERVLGIPEKQLKAVLNCEWFCEKAGIYALTPEGNQHVR